MLQGKNKKIPLSCGTEGVYKKGRFINRHLPCHHAMLTAQVKRGEKSSLVGQMLAS
jgi:hypothetical protein